MNKKWEIRKGDNLDKRVEEIKSKFNIRGLVARIIATKNLPDEKIEQFLKPTRHDFYDPFLMPDMDKAIDRITKAIKKSEKIVIYGDYDADGITSTTILKRFFKDLKVEVRNIHTK